MYLYRAIDSVGDTVEFLFSENRDLLAAKRFLRKALERHGALSSTAAKPTARRSFPAMLKAVCGTARDVH
jgi:transposase-like protein